jgi:xylulokinase
MHALFGIDLGTTGVKAALLAGVASGIYRSIQQACDSTIRLVEHTEPRPEVERVYARRYETYRALYPALKPILMLNSE